MKINDELYDKLKAITNKTYNGYPIKDDMKTFIGSEYFEDIIEDLIDFIEKEFDYGNND